jgi:hypothetical protein
MDLHQIQVTYQPEDDRILLRVSCRADDGALEEIRAWLTRRVVKSLWTGLLRSLDSWVKLTKPQAAHASTEILSMEYQASVSEIKASGNFDKPFESEVDRYPFGDTPLLVTGVQFHLDAAEAIRASFSRSEQEGFEVHFSQKAMHGFSKLLQEAAENADWELELKMPSFAQYDAKPQRMLN